MNNFQGKGSNQRKHDKIKFNDSYERIYGNNKNNEEKKSKGEDKKHKSKA